MAKSSDVDSVSAVRKFLERTVTINREDAAADKASEVQAILESIAVTFLLFPQAALSFVMKAKNLLQQTLTADLEVLAFLFKAVDDVNNPDTAVSDTSDLVEAQTALVEVDRIGRLGSDVKAYGRYTSAVKRFLNVELGKSLKRRRRSEFERSGSEAKEDIFATLSYFGPMHTTMAADLQYLVDSVASFERVDLSQIVATQTVTRVRSSLRRVLKGVQDRTLSNTAAALELLAGTSALESIANTRTLFDPSVETGVLPSKRDIRVSSETVPATATSTISGLLYLSPGSDFIMKTESDPDFYTVTLPYFSSSGKYWILGSPLLDTYPLGVLHKLYVHFSAGPGGSLGLDGEGHPIPEQTVSVSLPTTFGGASLAQILDALNAGLTWGTAVEVAPGSNRLLLVAFSQVFSMTVVGSVPGTYDEAGVYTAATPSAHTILGFTDGQTGEILDSPSPQFVAAVLAANVPTATFDVAEGGRLKITSKGDPLTSSLSFKGELATYWGFIGTVTAEPSYLELVEDGAAIDPLTVDVYPGSLVVTNDINLSSNRNLSSPIKTVEGTRLRFSVPLPRCTKASVIINAPIVYAVRRLLMVITPSAGTFANDALNLQRVLSPLVSRPTLAQINDAKKYIQALVDKLTVLLEAMTVIEVHDDAAQYAEVAKQIVRALEERSIDRGLDLLNHGRFFDFFSLATTTASTGSRLMAAIEVVGRTDLASVTTEEDLRDLEPVATNTEAPLQNRSTASDRDGVVR
jgi:hypothetical protein